MKSLRAVAAVAATAVLLAACSSEPEAPAETPTSIPPATQTAAATSAGQPVGHASASDGKGDGKDADLVAVRLDGDDQGLTVKYTLSKQLPIWTAETAMLMVYAASLDGNHSWQLAVKWINGEPGVFVFDNTTAQQANLDGRLQVAGKSVTVTYPAAFVSALGPSFKWGAYSTLDGADMDACPNNDGALNLASIPFPSV